MVISVVNGLFRGSVILVGFLATATRLLFLGIGVFALRSALALWSGGSAARTLLGIGTAIDSECIFLEFRKVLAVNPLVCGRQQHP